MFVIDGSVVWSPSDLVVAARCEYATARRLDEVLAVPGAPARPAAEPDEMLDRAGELGDVHEQRVLDAWVAEAGPEQVVSVAVTPSTRRAVLEEAHAATLAAIEAGVRVVHQATFFDGEMYGRADFLVREDDGAGGATSGPTYAVHDAKLARRAKVEALLQLGAYADRLAALGVGVAPEAHLVLGDRTTTTHRVSDVVPVFRERRDRLRAVIALRADATSPVAWGDRDLPACGRCGYCTEQVAAHDDVLLVAGVRGSQRAVLADAGITTVAQLAAATVKPASMGASTFERLRVQAALQAGTLPVDGTVRWDTEKDGKVEHEERSWKIVDTTAIDLLPPPSPGDLFFDFEGDPLWSDPSGTAWNLDYLFGYVERPVPGEDPPFTAYWAHDLAQEKAALVAFLDDLAERRRRHPDLHVYHYAAYEKTHLLAIAARHGTYENEVDDLLREGVLVDLYAVVRHALRISSSSYSIKKLEPLYMGANLRGGDVKDAAASVVAYAAFCAMRDAGDDEGAASLLAGIADYNRYDCVSTLGLLEWLRWAAEHRGQEPPASFVDRGAVPAGERDTLVEASASAADPEPEPDESARAEGRDLALRIRALVGEDRAHRTDDEQVLALLGAAVGYYEREDKPFWHEHYSRLSGDPDDWMGRRNAFLVERVDVVSDWQVEPRRRNASRVLELRGRLEDGSDLRVGTEPYLLYDRPLPACAATSEDGVRGWTKNAAIIAVGRDRDQDVLTVREALPTGADEFTQTPMAVTPSPGPRTGPQEAAVLDAASTALDRWESAGELPRTAATSLLRRTPGVGLPPVGTGRDRFVDAIDAAVRLVDDAYVAVQGPPGTGKTHVASHVIARLVRDGWRIGVVGQSHAVVENLLSGIVTKAGIDGDVVAKKLRAKAKPTGAPWREVDGKGLAAHTTRSGGFVVGGTAWDFANSANFPDRGLDLLVVDEAGQFSLANTIAVARSARRILLLGDPQQLGQVTQGQHPEPVDVSALAHLIGEHGVLPAEHGYFLETTWRMHPALADAVSTLSYEGRLEAEPSTAERHLAGVEPGVSCIEVEHLGNVQSSTQEAEVVVEVIEGILGAGWTVPGPDGPTTRPLVASDVIVVAAYNAQVWCVRDALVTAGLASDPDDAGSVVGPHGTLDRGVAVGTVDKFQGQEAVVAILTTAASSADDAPRGTGFLLSRNRVNVAVSRGQWCAVVVRSTHLTGHLPTTPHELEELGAFIGLCGARRTETTA